MEQPGMRIVAYGDLTPRWDIYRARTAGYMRWTHNYMLGPKERNPFPDDPVVTGSQVHVKLFSLAPQNIQPPHKHDEDVIFAVVAGALAFSRAPRGDRSAKRVRSTACTCRRTCSMAASTTAPRSSRRS